MARRSAGMPGGPANGCWICTGRAKDDFFFLDVLHGLDAGALHDGDNGCRLGEAADPRQFFRFEGDSLLSYRLVERDGVVECGEDRAVLGRGAVEEVHGLDAGSARHIFDHKGGISRDELTEVARDEACVGVITAARTGPDDDTDLLAGKKVARILRLA